MAGFLQLFQQCARRALGRLHGRLHRLGGLRRGVGGLGGTAHAQGRQRAAGRGLHGGRFRDRNAGFDHDILRAADEDEVLDIPISIDEAIRFVLTGGVLVPERQAIGPIDPAAAALQARVAGTEGPPVA